MVFKEGAEVRYYILCRNVEVCYHRDGLADVFVYVGGFHWNFRGKILHLYLSSAGGEFSLRQGEQVEGERDRVSWRGGVRNEGVPEGLTVFGGRLDFSEIEKSLFRLIKAVEDG